jgi:hypothetical protein
METGRVWQLKMSLHIFLRASSTLISVSPLQLPHRSNLGFPLPASHFNHSFSQFKFDEGCISGCSTKGWFQDMPARYLSVLDDLSPLRVGFDSTSYEQLVIIFLNDSKRNPSQLEAGHHHYFLRIITFFNRVTERRGRVVNIPGSYMGGPAFKPRPGNQLSWQKFVMVFLIPPRQIHG